MGWELEKAEGAGSMVHDDGTACPYPEDECKCSPDPEVIGHALEFKRGEFVECESCAAKPGSPPLCRRCLHNRGTVRDHVAAFVDLKRRARVALELLELGHLDEAEEVLRTAVDK